MSADKPTVDDLRVMAHNLRHEGQTSRAEVVFNAALALERAEAALRSVEYIDIADTFGSELINELTPVYFSNFRFCPECGYKKPDGHWKDCSLDAALNPES